MPNFQNVKKVEGAHSVHITMIMVFQENEIIAVQTDRRDELVKKSKSNFPARVIARRILIMI